MLTCIVGDTHSDIAFVRHVLWRIRGIGVRDIISLGDLEY
jgi:hypothetical protein